MVARYLGMYEGEKVFHNIQGSMSAHTVIVGKSGSGNTVKAQQLMLETVERGCAVLTFDFHRVLADEEILPTLKHKFNQHLMILMFMKMELPVICFRLLQIEREKQSRLLTRLHQLQIFLQNILDLVVINGVHFIMH